MNLGVLCTMLSTFDKTPERNIFVFHTRRSSALDKVKNLRTTLSRNSCQIEIKKVVTVTQRNQLKLELSRSIHAHCNPNTDRLCHRKGNVVPKGRGLSKFTETTVCQLHIKNAFQRRSLSNNCVSLLSPRPFYHCFLSATSLSPIERPVFRCQRTGQKTVRKPCGFRCHKNCFCIHHTTEL